MSFWDDLQEKAKQVAKKASDTFDEVKETTSVEFQVLKIKRQISLAESEIKELQSNIGKRVYDIRTIQPESFASPEIQGWCDKITELLGHISEQEKEIVNVREAPATPKPPEEGQG